MSAPAHEQLSPALCVLRRRLGLFQKLIPAGMALLVIVYEIALARWIHGRLGLSYHYVAEILVYGTVGPLLVFALQHFVGRWLEERETSDLQAHVLAQASEHARRSRELADDAFQALFAASVVLGSLEADVPEPTPEATSQLRETQQVIDDAAQQLHTHLANQPLSDSMRRQA